MLINKYCKNKSSLNTKGTWKIHNIIDKEKQILKQIKISINNNNLLFNNTNTIAGIISINISNSNIIINVSNLKGQTIYKSSSGLVYFKGNQKIKKYTIAAVIKNVIDKVETLKLPMFAVHFRGLKRYRSLVVRLLKKRFVITLIKQYYALPHNGCRQKKSRRT